MRGYELTALLYCTLLPSAAGALTAFGSAILPMTDSEARLRRVAKSYGTHFSYIGRTTRSTIYKWTTRRTCTSLTQPAN